MSHLLPTVLGVLHLDDALTQNRKLAEALGLESERLTVALEALHKLLELKPPGVEAMELYFAMRDIARGGILGKQ